MSKGDEMILLDFWASPFCMRVRIALEEKRLSCERREEDLFGGKSELLLKSNPINKQVPVLLHNGKALCESSIIVGYIDETWPSPPLLPPSSYERSQARFWVDYIDKKVFDTIKSIVLGKGEAAETAKNELIETFKVLEGSLGNKHFFGGESFGFVDIIGIPLTSWFLAAEKLGNFKIEDNCPNISAWTKRCLKRESVAKVLADPEKVYEFVLGMRKMLGIDN